MKQVFKIGTPFRVPDSTLVSPFLNSKDSESGLPFDLLDGFSLAAGIIESTTRSKIHIMPHVTQVTFVRRGNLQVQMRAPADAKHYTLDVEAGQAVITEPGVFFQLINNTEQHCEVLYIVTPAYLFEIFEGKVIYDDSCVLEESWAGLEEVTWQPNTHLPIAEERRAAERRMATRSINSKQA